jgi:hypothetical protein
VLLAERVEDSASGGKVGRVAAADVVDVNGTRAGERS